MRARGVDTSELDALASILPRIANGQISESIAHFHNSAGRFPYVGDSDFGALLLESAADATNDAGLARELLTAALFRAKWCVQAATSGGEGIARAADLNRIQAKLDGLQ